MNELSNVDANGEQNAVEEWKKRVTGLVSYVVRRDGERSFARVKCTY